MRTSELLAKLAGEPNDRLTIADILAALGDRSFALLVVILGLPNCIPMPPPIPIFCALLLIGVAVQIGMGRKAPCAPRFVLTRSVARKDLAKAAAKAIPLLQKLERFSQPRFDWLGHPRATLAVGALLLALALGVLTAAPFIGQIPWGWAVCLLGLGLVERDGLLIVAAVIFGAAALETLAVTVYSATVDARWGADDVAAALGFGAALLPTILPIILPGSNPGLRLCAQKTTNQPTKNNQKQ
jgi:hypothetical protein